MSPDLRIRFVEPPAAILLPGRTYRAVGHRPSSKQRQAKPGPTSFPEQPGDRVPAEDPEANLEQVDPGAQSQVSRSPVGPAEATPDWAVAQGRIEELLRRIESEISHLERRFAEDVRRLEPQLVRLSLAVTAKVLGQAMAEGSIDVAALVREGLTRITNSMREPKRITIRVGADHKSAVDAVLAERQDEQGRIRVEVDPGLKPFACEIHCDMRQVTIDLERELKRIGEALLGGGQDDE